MKSFRHTPQYLNWQRIRASLFLGVTPALAMTSLSVQSQEGLQLEEVLVTATRRVSDLQTTPVAVTAIDGEKFDSLFADSIADVALLTPNFSAAHLAPSLRLIPPCAQSGRTRSAKAFVADPVMSERSELITPC